MASDVAGPRTTRLEATRSFTAPLRPASGIGIGRLVSGPAWPDALPRVDRLAALPTPAPGPWSDGSNGETVLGLRDATGNSTPICVRAGDDVCWSVDPVAWIRDLLAERYVTGWRRPLTSRVPGVNYSRLPNRVKGWLERLASPRSPSPNPVAFPGLPFDPLVETLRSLCAQLAGSGTPRRPALWPGGRRAAVTLTHDVDVSWILEERRSDWLARLVDGEASLGFRGAWYVTANRLDPRRHAAALRRIRDADHEVGAHGWSHDSRLGYLDPQRQRQRMGRIRERMADIGVEGIRTPWYCRSPQLFEVLADSFVYDSSVPNASGYFSSGCNSGCCTVLPYEATPGLYELPLTLPPDTTLDPRDGYSRLLGLCNRIVDLGGVLVATLHPQPHQSANPRGLDAYFAFLRALVDRHGSQLWHATPREIVEHYARLC